LKIFLFLVLILVGLGSMISFIGSIGLSFNFLGFGIDLGFCDFLNSSKLP
jgi:hypothetical protein